jgi:hypothetical protein
MGTRLTLLFALALVLGRIGTTEAVYNTVGVYDPDDEPYHNQVDQSGTYSSHTGDAGPANVIDLATFQALIGPAFAADAGGVVNFENADGGLDDQNIIANFGIHKTKTLTIANTSGLINTGSSVKNGRTPTSGHGRIAKTDTANFAFAIGPMTGGKPDEVVTHFGGTLLGRDEADLAPVVTATFSGGGTVTAVATMSGTTPGITQDTFFGFVAPPGQSIVSVDFNPTGGPYTNMDDVAFITSAFVVPSPGASRPHPGSGQADVPGDVVLSWTAGTFAKTHDVYFGTAFADVNTASRTNPQGVLVRQDQEAVTYDPSGLLAFGQTYYWRVDEVNAAPDNTITQGSVWSFTVEPYAYPIKNVTATASSAREGMGPERTIDSSGLDSADQHSTVADDMWLSTGATPNWIQYQFDQPYELGELQVWNSNQADESLLGLGARSVTIEYSADGATWTELPGVPEFARATGTPTYIANTTVKFGGVLAKYVKLTIHSTWGATGQSGLSEVRFSYLPVQAREPEPAVAATGVGLDVTLNWRPGREAVSHQVYLDTDPQAVAAAATAATTVADHCFTPSALRLDTIYYWRVDEVNEMAATRSWAGDVWSFTTAAYVIVDDFESYDDDTNCIFDTWIDGVTDGRSGSQVGYTNAPFAEQKTVHGDIQSMPLQYNNAAKFSFSEAVRAFAVPQDWTASGIKILSLWFYGVPGNSGQLYVKINSTKVPYNGAPGDLAKPAWTVWNVDLSAVGADLSKVTSLTIGIEGSGSSGLICLDDIRLYPKAP